MFVNVNFDNGNFKRQLAACRWDNSKKKTICGVKAKLESSESAVSQVIVRASKNRCPGPIRIDKSDYELINSIGASVTTTGNGLHQLINFLLTKEEFGLHT